MHFAALAAEVAFLHIFLGIVPCAARVGHEDGQHEAGGQAAHQQADDAGNSEYQARQHRGDDGQQRGEHHFALGALGGNLHAAGVVRFGLARQDALDFAELPAHFFHHVACRAAHGVHRQAAEEEGHHAADEHAGKHLRVHQRHVVVGHEVGERCVLDGEL